MRVQVTEQCRQQTAEIEKLTGRLQASMESEAELQQHRSEKADELSGLQRQVEQLRQRADKDSEALAQAHQQAHQQRTENADLLAELRSAQDDNAFIESQLVSAREEAAAACDEVSAARQELRSSRQQVAAQASKIEDSERQVVASAAEIEHLDQALSRSEQGKAMLRAEARTAAEACNLAINEQIAAGQRHEAQMLLSEATISQLQDAATHRLRQLQELSEERDAVVADRAAAQQHMREQSSKLQHSQLRLLKEQRLSAAAEASVLALRQQLSGLQQQLRQVLPSERLPTTTPCNALDDFNPKSSQSRTRATKARAWLMLEHVCILVRVCIVSIGEANCGF